MASPFKVFRKNQRAALAVLGVLVIVGFVILPALLQVQGGGGRRENPVVVETSEFGDLKQSDINKLLNRRQVAIRFATAIRGQVGALGGTGEAAYYFLRRIGSEPTEQAVVRDWLLANRAKQAGIVISDATINGFIKQLTEGRIADRQIEGMLGNMSVSPGLLFDVLTDELLAREMDLEMRLGLMGTTPGQRWDYFRRLERFATVEVIPVSVSDCVSEVTQEPKNHTLKAFFDENKDRIPNPDSPEWGFCRPKRVSLRYFKADLNEFMDAGAVTDEEVEKYYQDNKELCDQWAKILNTAAPANGDDQPDETQEPDETKKPDDTEQPQEETPGADATPTDTSTDSAPEGDTRTEPDAEPSDASEEPADTSPDEEEQESGDRPGNDESSSTKAASPFRPVSLLQEETPENETDDAASADAEESSPTTEPSETESDTSTPEGEPEVETPEADKTAEPDAPPAEPDAPPAEPDAPPAEPDAPPVVPGDDKQSEPEKTPEDPLKGPLGAKIRNDLAYEKATAKVDDIFELLKKEMKRYRHDLAKAKPATSGPKKPDFKKLADQHGVDVGYLKEKSRREVLQSEVGTSMIDQSFLANYVYDVRRGQHHMPMASERTSIRYLSWTETATESRESQQNKKKEDRLALPECHGVPEYNEPGVAAEVLEAWKIEQARPLAVEAAKTLADEARKSGKPLAKAFPDHDVKTTEPFTWLTFGSVPAGLSRTPPKVSQVKGVDRPGPDFFRKVLNMKVGDIGVVKNHPQTTVYVIRVVEVNPTQEALWRDFQTDVTFHDRVYQSAGWVDMNEINVALKKELESAAGVKWLRPADPTRNE